MQVSDILKADEDVVTIATDRSIVDVAHTLASKGVGAICATETSGKLAGIISERDIVRALDEHGAAMLAMRVEDLMTSSVITGTPDSSIVDVMKLMTEHHIRHLPVLEDSVLIGVVAIHDVVRSRLAEVETDYGTLREFMSTRIE